MPSELKTEFAAVKRYLGDGRQFDFVCVCGQSSKIALNSAAGVFKIVFKGGKRQKKITALLAATIEFILYHG